MVTSVTDELNVRHLFELLDQADASSPALIDGDEQLSFGQIRQQAQQWSWYLQRELSLKPGQRVAFFDQKHNAQIILLFAVWRAGGVAIPISPNLKAAQVLHILADSEASILITTSTRADMLALQEALPSTLHQVVTTDKPWKNEVVASEYCQRWSKQEAVKSQEPGTESLAALLYTSGSTGQPKGVMLSHHNVLLGVASVSQYLELSSSDRVLSVLPLSFDYGLNQILSAWYVGACVALHNFFLPASVGADLEKHQITVLAGVPPLWRQVLSKLSLEQCDSLRLVTNSGGALTPEIQVQLAKLNSTLKIYSMYGLTEAFRSSYLAPEQLKHKPRSVGRAIPYARLLVVDEDLRCCERGIPGELLHTGPLVAQGYWNQPEQTAQRFIELPAQLASYEGERGVLSGDLAYLDEEGDLFILGRRDEQIKTSGYRVSPQEVEELALSIEGIQQAACFGIADDELGQAIALVIHGEHTSEAAFRSQYQMLAANYLWPKYLLHYENMPLNSNGKIDRPLLKRRVINEVEVSS